jgi:hypothetical protein
LFFKDRLYVPQAETNQLIWTQHLHQITLKVGILLIYLSDNNFLHRD